MQLFADRPQVRAILDFVPAGTPNGSFATFTGAPRPVELGDLTGSSLFVFDDQQGSVRVDHRFNDKNLLYGRYRFDSQDSSGDGQVTPPGLTSVTKRTLAALAIVLNSVLTSKFSNEARVAWSRFRSSIDAENPLSKTIPSITITQLGMAGAPFTVTLGSDVLGTGNPIRPNLNTNLDLSSMTITEIRAAGGANLFGPLLPGQRIGTAGRNILRSDGIKLIDFGIIKNTRVTENIRFQLRADMFNSFNSRNFGIPNGAINSGDNFLNQWATNGGNRRIILGARLVF